MATIKSFSNLPSNISIGINCKIEHGHIEIDANSHFECGDGFILNGFISIKENSFVKFGNACKIKGSFNASQSSKIEIGHGLACNGNVSITAREYSDINIGNDCLFDNTIISTTDFHSIFDLQSGTRLNPAKSIKINNRVWAAKNSMILKGCTIGSDCVVSAGAVVTRSHESNCVIAGQPAQTIKHGIVWSRALCQHAPLQFEDDFSISNFLSDSQNKKYKSAISQGIKYIHLWRECSIENYSLFYYLACAIYYEHLCTHSKITINGILVTRQDIYSIFKLCFEISKNSNIPAGALTIALGETINMDTTIERSIIEKNNTGKSLLYRLKHEIKN